MIVGFAETVPSSADLESSLGRASLSPNSAEFFPVLGLWSVAPNTMLRIFIGVDGGDIGSCDSLFNWFKLDNFNSFPNLGVDLSSGELEGEFLSIVGHARYLCEHASINLAHRQG